MPLPDDFPTPPRRPPSTVAMVMPDGTISRPWADYFDRKERYDALVRAHLDSL